MIPFLFILVIHSLCLFFLCQPSLKFVNFVLFEDPAFGFIFSIVFLASIFSLLLYLFYSFPSFTVSLVCQPYLQFKSFKIVSCFVAWDTLHQVFPDSPFISFRTQFLWTPLLTIQSKGAYSYFLSQHHVFFTALITLYFLFCFFVCPPTCLHMHVCICAYMCMHIP